MRWHCHFTWKSVQAPINWWSRYHNIFLMPSSYWSFVLYNQIDHTSSSFTAQDGSIFFFVFYRSSRVDFYSTSSMALSFLPAQFSLLTQIDTFAYLPRNKVKFFSTYNGGKFCQEESCYVETSRTRVLDDSQAFNLRGGDSGKYKFNKTTPYQYQISISNTRLNFQRIAKK